MGEATPYHGKYLRSYIFCVLSLLRDRKKRGGRFGMDDDAAPIARGTESDGFFCLGEGGGCSEEADK